MLINWSIIGCNFDNDFKKLKKLIKLSIAKNIDNKNINEMNLEPCI